MKNKDNKTVWSLTSPSLKTSEFYAPLDKNGLYILAQNPNGGGDDAVCCIYKENGHKDEAEANAQLISAAPELFKALQESYEYIMILRKQLPMDMQNMLVEKHRKLYDMEMEVQIRNEKAISKAIK